MGNLRGIGLALAHRGDALAVRGRNNAGKKARGAHDALVMGAGFDFAIEADNAVSGAETLPTGEPERLLVAPLDGSDILELAGGDDRPGAACQIEQADFAGHKAAIARPSLEKGNTPAGGIDGGSQDLPAGFMDDPRLAGGEIDPGKLRVIPAALAGIGRDDGNGAILAEQVELPDGEIGRPDLRRFAIVEGNAIETPAGVNRIGDRGIFFIAPGKARGPGRGRGVQAAIGSQCDQRAGIAAPADILNGAANFADRPRLRPRSIAQQEERHLAGRGIAAERVAGRPERQLLAAAGKIEAPDPAGIGLLRLAGCRADGCRDRLAIAPETEIGGMFKPVDCIEAGCQGIHHRAFWS